MAHASATPAPRSRPRPALRLVGTKELSREDWLAVRKHGIGSSDAAAAVGLNPYKSQLELWLEKTGRDAGLPKSDPTDEESPTYWGNMLEPIVATHYRRRTGNRVRRVNAVLQHPDPKLNWMLANIDREVIGASDVQILECKTAGLNGALSWKDGVPVYVQLQVMHQLAVTGKQAADVAVLLGGQHLEVHRLERDDALIAQLIELERDFWGYVQSDTSPPADGSESAAQALRCLYPEDQGHTLDFTQEPLLSAAFDELQSVRASLEIQGKREAELKQQLQQAMGEASRALFANGAVSWRKAKDSVVLDVPRLLKEKPYLLARYPTTKIGSRRFLIT
ncbi:YqaJ viral recombinase family protein [Pseudomonas sp. R3.Fl]|uniref:YqaJ viral recombinase family nuclease n=1 Tax=Pseudomonas sp. R3.Fl TaxID=2928708 RepID=UPI00201E720E|nr:YqaJ viral recombinase family protein [Pseudomonas sp. R3.Fl]MCL6691691.1 YqaJ viral recombinase family protein [Pseudomonas sp. R3.Fl]